MTCAIGVNLRAILQELRDFFAIRILRLVTKLASHAGQWRACRKLSPKSVQPTHARDHPCAGTRRASANWDLEDAVFAALPGLSSADCSLVSNFRTDVSLLPPYELGTQLIKLCRRKLRHSKGPRRSSEVEPSWDAPASSAAICRTRSASSWRPAASKCSAAMRR